MLFQYQDKEYRIQRGNATPFGAVWQGDSVNFAVYAKDARCLKLKVFHKNESTPFLEYSFDPKKNRSGLIWHAQISGLPPYFEYVYELEDDRNVVFPKLIDPYTHAVSSTHQWGSNQDYAHAVRATCFKPDDFDWQNIHAPMIPIKDLVIYEMHVRGFTLDASSKVKNPGTFSGIIEKIPYFKQLGINAIELLPIYEFNECEVHRKNPKTKELLYNFWGYSTVNFFSLMNRFGSSEDVKEIILEFKTMVRELHRNGIEVILDVVYNHTAEQGVRGPALSFKGFAESDYYMTTPSGEYLNFSGCGNTFNCNHPVTKALILDSLRYWKSEMRVDGFRFDLASILTRAADGTPLADPPVVKEIALDPILSNAKLIAEAWDAGGLYQVGYFPSYRRWAEWNGKYRDAVRKFIKGTDGVSGEFAGMLTGSEILYKHDDRKPYHSINFVTCHDGFTLRDLVSYNDKHNLENAEGNRDGANDNESWNCGAEGDTKDPSILSLRERQMKNFHLALMLSIGVPMLHMGDEYGHTKKGNNNTWCQDSKCSYFDWECLEKNPSFFRFYSKLVHYRMQQPLLRKEDFLNDYEIAWHGSEPLQPNWAVDNRLVAFSYLNDKKENLLYGAFNSSIESMTVKFPQAPDGKQWYLRVDTNYASPDDFIEEPTHKEPLQQEYVLAPYSALLVEAL